jgi:hypothetical protein
VNTEHNADTVTIKIKIDNITLFYFKALTRKAKRALRHTRRWIGRSLALIAAGLQVAASKVLGPLVRRVGLQSATAIVATSIKFVWHAIKHLLRQVTPALRNVGATLGMSLKHVFDSARRTKAMNWSTHRGPWPVAAAIALVMALAASGVVLWVRHYQDTRVATTVTIEEATMDTRELDLSRIRVDISLDGSLLISGIPARLTPARQQELAQVAADVASDHILELTRGQRVEEFDWDELNVRVIEAVTEHVDTSGLVA